MLGRDIIHDIRALEIATDNWTEKFAAELLKEERGQGLAAFVEA
jgi:hypothetical protein